MLFEKYRTNKKLEIARMNLDLTQINAADKFISEVSRIVRPDIDDAKWFKTGEVTSSSDDAPSFLNYDHYQMLEEVFKKYHTNLFARAIVRNLSKFILGKGPTIKARSDNKKVQDYWNLFVKNNKWSLREKELVIRAFRDGEVLLRKFVNTTSGDTSIRFLKANSIRNPSKDTDKKKSENVTFGIGTNPEDIEDIKTYYQCNADGSLVKAIDASEVIHIKILADSDMKRGVSFMLSALPMIQKYLSWLDDRIVLNQIRSAIALVRTVKGTSGTVGSIRDAQISEVQDSDTNKQKAFKRGTVLTASRGIEYSMLSPNIQASDVKDDGRAMLLAVCAGMGMPEMFLTADFSNANYSSSMVAQNPFVREIEDWQDFFTYYYKVLFSDVINVYIEHGDLPNNTNVDCEIEWPPLILADILKNNQAREVQHRNKILSKTTWQKKEALDPDIEKKNMEEEQEMDIYKTPFNMPTSPTNQFGSEFEDDYEDEE